MSEELMALTVKDVEDRAKRAVDSDDYRYRSREELMWADVLRAVALGHPQSAELAAAALTSEKLRWKKMGILSGDPIDPESLFDAEATEDEKNAFMAALDDLDRGV